MKKFNRDNFINGTVSEKLPYYGVDKLRFLAHFKYEIFYNNIDQKTKFKKYENCNEDINIDKMDKVIFDVKYKDFLIEKLSKKSKKEDFPINVNDIYFNYNFRGLSEIERDDFRKLTKELLGYKNKRTDMLYKKTREDNKSIRQHNNYEEYID